MMKPLGYITYFLNHKKRVITVVIALALCIFLIGEIDSFVNSMVATQSREFEKFKYFSHITVVDREAEQDIIYEIRNHESVEKVLQTYDYSLKIPSIGANAKFKGYVLGQDETAGLISKMDIRISKGNLPGPGEIIVNEHILRAKDLDEGGYYTVDDKDYLISGVLTGENVTSFIVDDVPGKSREYLVVFKDGRMESASKMLNGYSKTKLSVWGYHENVELVKESVTGTKDLLNIMVVSSIIFLSIIIGNYSHVFNIHRIREFGVFKAIGYSRKKLLLKVLLEILITSCAGLFIGFLLMFTVNRLVSVFYLYPNGNAPIRMRWGIVPKLIPIPLAISVFVFIPVSRLLDKIDPILIIERMGR